MSGPGDRAFLRWVKRHVSPPDAVRVLDAYKRAGLVRIDNRAGTFHVLDRVAVSREALVAAAENLRPQRKRWNRLSDAEREKLVASKRAVPDQWERQERIELAIAKLG